MKLETIIQAALNDMEYGREEPHYGTPARNDREPLDGITRTNEFAEPGYDNPKAGILFADWNRYPRRLADILERAGYAIEWEDVWTTCGDCNRAVRTSPDSYGWKQSYVILNDCDIVCTDCAKNDLDTYEAYLLNSTSKADTFDVDWSERGFTKFNKESYESGFHPGQNDDPKKIAKLIPTEHDFLFSIPSVGQFDLYFDCWIREREGIL